MGTPVKIQKNKFKQPFKNKNLHGKKFIKRQKNPEKMFLNNVRSFAKKGNYGRGTDIEEESFTYFLKILEALRKPAQFSFERVAMANNVLEETKEKEIHLSSNQVVSKAIEALIGFAGEEHLERFFDVFGDNFRPICSDPYASHVLQKMIGVALLRAVGENKIEENEEPEAKPWMKSEQNEVTEDKYNLETKFPENHKEKCAAFVERISKFLLNNLEDFVSDDFGNHLIRTCVYSLGGVYVPKGNPQQENPGGKYKPKAAKKKMFFKTPEAWHEILKEFPSRLEMWPQFPELAYNKLSSPLLGVICVAISQIEKSAVMRFGKKLLKKAFLNADAAKKCMVQSEQEDKKVEKSKEDDEDKEEDEENEDDEDKEDEEEKIESGSDEDKNGEEELPPAFLNENSRFLLETVLSVAGPKLFTEIYNTLFDGRFVELVKDKRGNFPIRVFLNHIKDKVLFEKIFEEIVGHFGEFLGIGNRGVFASISRVCLRLNTKQAAFVTALQSALQCSTADGEDRPKSLLTCLLKVKKFDELASDEDDFASVVGSLIVQDILQFKKPIVLVNCILQAYPRDLSNIFRTLHGSFVADAFLKSESIGEKSREKFVRLLDGFYMDLAICCYGSRALEKIFYAANETQKVRIAKELTSRDNKLKTTPYGRLMYNKLRLETFKLSSEQWKASWTTKEKKEDTLTKIVNKKKRTSSTSDEAAVSKKKK